jgi:hypothetical protein
MKVQWQVRAAMIRPIKIVGAAETDNMNRQSSLALRLVDITLTCTAISKELREANAKMAVTTSIVIERIESTAFGQNSSRATIPQLPLDESNDLLSLPYVRLLGTGRGS